MVILLSQPPGITGVSHHSGLIILILKPFAVIYLTSCLEVFQIFPFGTKENHTKKPTTSMGAWKDTVTWMDASMNVADSDISLPQGCIWYMSGTVLGTFLLVFFNLYAHSETAAPLFTDEEGSIRDA